MKEAIKNLFKEKELEELTKLDLFCQKHLLAISLINILLIGACVFFLFKGFILLASIIAGVGAVSTFLNRKGNIAHNVLYKAGKLSSSDSNIATQENEKPKKDLEQGDFL